MVCQPAPQKPKSGSSGFRIEITEGQHPINIEIDARSEKPPAQICTPVPVPAPAPAPTPAPEVPVSHPKQSHASVSKAMTKNEKEEAKLEKMKEIQDTVQALRKQLEDIEKKDNDDDGSSHNKAKDDDDDDEEATEKQHLQLNEKKNAGIQILAEKESISNTTTNASTTDEKQAKFDRFTRAQKAKQLESKTLAASSSQKPSTAAPAPAPTPAATNKNPIDLVIVQDFHQAKAISGQEAEKAMKMSANSASKKEESHHGFAYSILKKVMNFFQLNW